ncbi:hypothetical protein BDY21DRAFT_202695 [Lineolata rhizophorae]|uniref:Lon N-terminal domain-containing protein n=1 Tax=Lineolata rhizophorae TaxID=578093 RepID=A0A6A6P6W0_9PEZI|nr:hypothetical protein BDY21DRAFT_202695 [Lineolata rhizophorae]
MAKKSKPPQTQLLPLVPLQHPTILLPGTALRLPLASRADLAALLARLYARAAQPSSAQVTIGCVPLASPLLSRDGKQLLRPVEGEKADELGVEAQDRDMGTLREKDLFRYGTVARVSGVQGRRAGEVALVVEGGKRFRVEKVMKERPYFEGVVEVLDEEACLWQDLHLKLCSNPMS